MKLSRAVTTACITLAALALISRAVRASTNVEPLRLPQGATIAPVSDHVQMVSRGTIIAATIYIGQIQRVAVWRGSKIRVLGIVSQYATGGNNSQTLGALTMDGKLYVNAGYAFSGAYSGIKYHTFVYDGDLRQNVRLPHCDLAGETGDPLIEAASGDKLAVTFMSPSFIDLSQVDTGVYAPNAAIVKSRACDVIGRANILTINGNYAAGFQGYLGSTLAPTNVQVDQQTSVAVRWDGHRLERLGGGVAFDVNSRGDCVGSTVLPSYVGGTTYLGNGMVAASASKPNIPHAVLWRRNHPVMILEPRLLSFAYAIDDNERVVGMLQDLAGRHFAFIWRRGALKRLDSLVHEPRWRFESAYGFTPDGGILGIGTYDGIATAFVVHL